MNPKFCHQCGAALPKAAKFCQQCGTAVSGTTSRENVPDGLAENPVIKFVEGRVFKVLMVLLSIGILIFIFVVVGGRPLSHLRP